MEGGIAEEDYDEYDMILGEILNTTYVNPLTLRHRLVVPFEELDIISLQLEKESSPTRRAPKHYKSPQPATQQESMVIYGLDDQKLQTNRSNYKISEVISGQDNSNLPDDNSFTQSFEDMRIKEITAMIPSSPSSVKNNQSSSKITCLLNGHSANHLNKSLFGSRILNGITSPSVDLSNEIDC